jgi:hypothetical protein
VLHAAGQRLERKEEALWELQEGDVQDPCRGEKHDATARTAWVEVGKSDHVAILAGIYIRTFWKDL